MIIVAWRVSGCGAATRAVALQAIIRAYSASTVRLCLPAYFYKLLIIMYFMCLLEFFAGQDAGAQGMSIIQ